MADAARAERGPSGPARRAESGTAVTLVFFGTPEAAVVPFEALLTAGFDIPLVVSQPDRRRGRGRGTAPSPVKRCASDHGIEVVTPDRAREAIDPIRATGAERGVVVAFGQLLPPALLDAFPRGLVNLHYSLLPRWRGAAPVERAILAGDAETGVCVMDVEPTLDTGAVYAREVVTIGPDENAGELHARLTDTGAALLVRTLRAIDAIEPIPQAGESTYADKLTVDEFRLDPDAPASERVRQVRAGNPRPGAWLEVADGGTGRARLKVWRAHEEDGRFVPDEVQPEGKKVMSYAAWRAGHRGADPFA
jgi:methionyl-tRNA formyltransferase